ASILVDGQRLLPRFAAVGGFVYTAFPVRAEVMAERANEHGVRAARIDEDRADMACRGEAGGSPGLAAVGGFVYTVAGSDVVTRLDLPGADVDRLRLRRRNRHRTDRRGAELVGERVPGRAGIFALPHAAAGRA